VSEIVATTVDVVMIVDVDTIGDMEVDADMDMEVGVDTELDVELDMVADLVMGMISAALDMVPALALDVVILAAVLVGKFKCFLEEFFQKNFIKIKNTFIMGRHHRSKSEKKHNNCQNGQCNYRAPVPEQRYYQEQNSNECPTGQCQRRPRQHIKNCESGACGHRFNTLFDQFLNDPTW